MKRISLSIFFALIFFALLLTGCSSGKPKEPNQNEIYTQSPEQSPNILPTQTKAGYKKYMDFLGIDKDVEKIIEEDIDLDGKTEIVIACEADYGLKIFVIREDLSGELQKIGELGGGPYGTSGIEIVEMQNKKQKYILESLTNGSALSGFALYEIDGNEIIEIEYSASATGAGDDHLVDTNKDGFYDGYVQNTYSYDVFHFYVSRFYKWNGKDFVFDSAKIQLNDYPDNPRDVVSQFLKLNVLNSYEEKIDGVFQRLSELNISNRKITLKNLEDWINALQIDNIDYDVDEKGNTAKVRVTLGSETMTFDLAKKSNKWQITDITGANVAGVSSQNSTDGWFAGFIGNKPVHAKINISEDKVSGVYYYDEYKTSIKLEGYIDDFIEMKDYRTVYLSEDTDVNGKILGIFRTDDYIQGCWIKDDVIYPLYLIRESASIAAPKQPGANSKKFEGYWTGKESGYFAGSRAEIKVLFDDLIFYSLSAFNGTHSGILDGFGIIENNVARTAFKDKTYFSKDENVVFKFTIENDSLHLDSNDYSFYCGAGVEFGSDYVRGEIDIKMPTAMEVGIVETEEQDKLFRELVGDKYSDFIMYTSYVFYWELTWNGEEVKAGQSYLRGYSGRCWYIISKEHIYAAIIEDDGIYYYTNDKNYANKIPEPMTEWACMSDKIFYNYKELSI
ncbi:hypothetical protein [Acetivibrio straminisolvens]|nr:hypothetical protein [Acetivibrio straminisolvens]